MSAVTHNYMYIANKAVIKIFKVLALALLLVLTFYLYSLNTTAIAAPQVSGIQQNLSLDGYAWSSNIGWVSLNCRTGGVGQSNICATANYRVSIDPNGNLNGYAWSPNIGWIRFGGLSNFPTGAGTTPANAHFTGTFPDLELTGWARACSGTASPVGTCSDMNNNPAAGGWDGWISLRGSGYGISTNNFGSPQYAWGSTVVGWLDMSSHVDFAPSLHVQGCTIPIGGSSCYGNASWLIPGAVASPNLAQITPTPVDELYTGSVGANQPVLLGAGIKTFALRSGNNVIPGTEFSLSGFCPSGSVMHNGVCSIDPPVITITLQNNILRHGQTTTVTVTSSRALEANEQCVIMGGGLSGSLFSSGLSETLTTGPINNRTIIQVNCTGAFVPPGFPLTNASIDVVPLFIEI